MPHSASPTAKRFFPKAVVSTPATVKPGQVSRALSGSDLIAQGCQPIAQAGAALVDMLMQVIKGKRPDSNLLPTELIVCIDL